MTKAPIKERIVALRYKNVSDEVYREVCDALGVFLSVTFPNDGFVAERMNRPEVTLPIPTFGDIEPDWTKVKVSVDRPSRFWSSDRTKCIQFFKDCLTINLISGAEKSPWSHGDLFSFFEALLPFVVAHEKRFEILKCSVDYQNLLNQDQLKPYIVNNGETLELARLLKGNVLGQSIDGATFTPPIIHKVSYAPDRDTTKADLFPARLDVEIVVPRIGRDGWAVKVMLSAAGAEFPGLDKKGLLTYLDQMHDAVTKGFRTTFTDEIVATTECAK